MNDERNVDGYELAHYQAIEYGSGRAVGVKVFVKLSDRKLAEDDRRAARRAGDSIVKGIDLVTAQLDPDGPARRAAFRTEVEKIYADAGVLDTVYIEELPNGYCSDPCCLHRPWFRVTSRIGHVVIGWRKSVMSIDWGGTVIKKTGHEMFPHSDATRSERGIHAWGTARAVEFIRALHANA